MREESSDYFPTKRDAFAPTYRFTDIIPQSTFLEMRALCVGLARGPALFNWRWDHTTSAFVYHDGKERHVLKLSGTRYPPTSPPSEVTADDLAAALRGSGLGAVFIAQYAVHATLHKEVVTVNLDDFAEALGWDSRNLRERIANRARVWSNLRLIAAIAIVGSRPGTYHDYETHKTLNLAIDEPLIQIAQTWTPFAQSEDARGIPLEVSFEAGPWLERLGDAPHVLTYFGDVRRIASLSGDKVTKQWAQSAWLGLNQFWREQAAWSDYNRPSGGGSKDITRVVFNNSLTRHELLNRFPPLTTPQSILRSAHPNRAKKYWAGVVDLLKEVEAVHSITEPEDPTRRQYWGKTWLGAELDIQPRLEDAVTMEGFKFAREAPEKAEKAREQQKQKRERAREKRKGKSPPEVAPQRDDVPPTW